MNMSSGVKILVGAVVAVVAVVGVLAIPVHERCGGAGRVCATAPDDQGFIYYYYEVQPVLTVLVDQFTGHKPLVYSSGVERCRSMDDGVSGACGAGDGCCRDG